VPLGRASRTAPAALPTLGCVQILWWLAPPVVATSAAMLWVAWLGRAGRGEVDREVAVRRLGDAMTRPAPPRRTTPTRAPALDERSTGVAVRRSTRPAPSTDGRTRRAS
jgi:hypothetical protein